MPHGNIPLWQIYFTKEAVRIFLEFVWKYNIQRQRFFDMCDEMYYQMRKKGKDVVDEEIVKLGMPKYI